MTNGGSDSIVSIEGFAARSVRCDFGLLAVDVFVVDSLDRLVDRDELLRGDDIPEPPYWAHLWVGSRALARHLAATTQNHSTAIDIGCGVGLAGLVAAKRGTHTTFLDHAREALAFVRASAERNHLEADLLVSDLRRPGVDARFDLCLAADATYDPELQRALADFLVVHLAPAGVAWCAESVRMVDGGFHDACRTRGLAVEAFQVTEMDEGVPVPVRLTRVAHV